MPKQVYFNHEAYNNQAGDVYNSIEDDGYDQMASTDGYQSFGNTKNMVVFDGDQTYDIENNVDKPYAIKTRGNSFGKPVNDPRDTFF